jgi:DNA-binding GntR family transcriptional regulator
VELPELTPIDDRPKHHQIAIRLREAIERGDYLPGMRFPGENMIMKRYRVARSTARQALAELATLGYIRTEPKIGTFVQEHRELIRKPRRYRRGRTEGPFATDARAAGLNPDVEATTDRIAADTDIASRLGIKVGDTVTRTTYRFLANGQPVQLSLSYEPEILTAGTEIEIPERGPLAAAGVVVRFDSIGIHIDTVTEDVSIRPPDPSETTALTIPRGVQVFTIRRTFKAAGQPIETADIVIPGDRYSLVYTFTVPPNDTDPVTI